MTREITSILWQWSIVTTENLTVCLKSFTTFDHKWLSFEPYQGASPHLLTPIRLRISIENGVNKLESQASLNNICLIIIF